MAKSEETAASDKTRLKVVEYANLKDNDDAMDEVSLDEIETENFCCKFGTAVFIFTYLNEIVFGLLNFLNGF